MKKRLFCLILILTVIVAASSVLYPVAADTSFKEKPENYSQNDVLSSRFLNMLNRNFVYGNDFENVSDIVDCSVLALLDKRDVLFEDYIDEAVVKSFVYDMYGVEAEDISSLNPEYPQKNGLVYIVPRGFSTYKHTVSAITENEDGTFTVVSNVQITTHENETVNRKAVSLFAENKESAFGYNIISCELN